MKEEADGWLATLKGGPGDGRRVLIQGPRYSVAVQAKRGRYHFIRADYAWAVAKDGSYIGTLLGYWNPAGKRVRKDGSKMPKKKRSKAKR